MAGPSTTGEQLQMAFLKNKKTVPVQKEKLGDWDKMHEEMKKLEEKCAKLDAVAKDEQWKRTVVEQKLEQRSQEGVKVFNALMSKITSISRNRDESAMTSNLPTSQSMPTSSRIARGSGLSRSVEQQQRTMSMLTMNHPARAQTGPTPVTDEVTNACRRAMTSPLEASSGVEDGISDFGAASVDPFRMNPLPEDIADDNEQDPEFALLQHRRSEAPSVHPEKISVSMFDGSKGTFEHWINSIEYHLKQTKLVNSDEATLCQFLITYLRSGSAPEMMISAARKARKMAGKPPNSFLSEIHALRSF